MTETERKYLTTKNRTVAGAVLPGKLSNSNSTELITRTNRNHPKADRYLNYGRGPVNFFLPAGAKTAQALQTISPEDVTS